MAHIETHVTFVGAAHTQTVLCIFAWLHTLLLIYVGESWDFIDSRSTRNRIILTYYKPIIVYRNVSLKWKIWQKSRKKAVDSIDKVKATLMWVNSDWEMSRGQGPFSPWFIEKSPWFPVKPCEPGAIFYEVAQPWSSSSYFPRVISLL